MSVLMMLMLGCGLQRESLKGSCFFDGCESEALSLEAESCDVLEQDCGEGEKCVYALDPSTGSSYATTCVDVIDDGADGDLCVQYAEGEDTCGAGLWCVESRCREFCDTHGDCSEGYCVIYSGDVSLCQQECSPVDEGACDPGMNCVDWGPLSTCYHSDVDPEAQWSSCSGDWDCSAGFSCADNPDDDGTSCQRRCDLTEPACASGLTCTDAEDAQYPDLGVCQ